MRGSVLFLGICVLCCLVFVVQGGCEERKKKKSLFDGMDSRTRTRMKSYLVNGYYLYEQHCASCHQSEGTGLKKLYPSLNKADCLSRPQDVACVMRYGSPWDGANGIRYPVKMPANPELRNIEIAEILTYISNAWDNHQGFFPVKEVDKYMRNCMKK